MKVLVADPCGFCYGVKRAIKMAEDAAKENTDVVTLGEIVHNPFVVENLARQGVACKNSLAEVPAGSTMIIRSHGVGPAIYEEAQAKGINVIDATCPNVMRAQRSAKRLADEGRFVVVIGEKKHPEVLSICAWGGESCLAIENEQDIASVPERTSYGVVSQTTFENEKFETLYAILQAKRPGDYKIDKTICKATSERQAAAQKMASEVDTMFIFGGYSSANTKHLWEICKKINKNSFHLEKAEEITSQMVGKSDIIGITAGASTPEETIKEAIWKMEETMDSLLGTEVVRLHIGMVVDAKVVQVGREEVIVDFGYQSEGAVAFDQWVPGGTRETVAPTVHEGDIVTLKVIASENQDHLVVMSKIKAEADKAWMELANLEDGKPLDVKGLKAVKGGLTVTVNNMDGVTGFIPASHLDIRRVEDIAAFEGKEMQVEVLEKDPAKKRLVLSRRELLKKVNAAYREEREARRQKRAEEEEASLATIVPNTTMKGVVKSVVDFGMFVEIAPSLQGLVHVSELSWDRGVKPADLYKKDDEVEVYVKGVDMETKRVSLSIKALQEDPWNQAVADIQEGDVVTGKVVRFLPFGAIVKLNDKVEGMVHVSEIADHRIEKPDDVLELGQEITAVVLNVEKKKKKVALSIKKVQANAEKAEMEQYVNAAPELSQDIKINE